MEVGASSVRNPVASTIAPYLREISSPSLVIVTVKSPIVPSAAVIRAEARTSIFRSPSTAAVIELLSKPCKLCHSPVPVPKTASFSNRVVRKPTRERWRAVSIAENPPPITRTSLFTGNSFLSNGCSNRALFVAILISSTAFSVTSPS